MIRALIAILLVGAVGAVYAKQDASTQAPTTSLYFEKQGDGDTLQTVKEISCAPPTKNAAGLNCFVDDTDGTLYISYAPATGFAFADKTK